MILEELIHLLVSFVFRPPEISYQISRSGSLSTFDESEEEDVPWAGMIHREYEETEQELQIQTHDSTSATYVSLGSESRFRRTFWQSVQRSLRANFGIVMAVIPLGLFAMGLIYFKLNTSQLCFEWRDHNDTSIWRSVMKWNVIGDDIESICVNLWFPVTLLLLFGWKEFKLNNISTLWVGFTVGAAVVIYKTFLVVFNVLATKDYYRYPVYALFFGGIIWSSILVARKFKLLHPFTSYSRFHIVVVVSLQAVVGFAIAMIYRHFIVTYFINLQGITKGIVAAITPTVALIPTAVCKYFALKESSEIIQPDRSFILAYFLRGGTIALYRLMQADFKNRWFFIALSLLHGFSNVLSKATEKLREKMWIRLFACLNKTFCGRRLELQPLDTPHYRRFKADIEIQNMLFEYNSIVISQVYMVLCLITSFNYKSPWLVIKESLIRMVIGLAIDLVFNCISVFIHIHYHDVPMQRVWFKCWKRHVISNAIILVVVILFFTSDVLRVFQTLRDEWAAEYSTKNCTLPFRSL